MTRSRPTAVMAIISAAMIRVAHAAAGMTRTPFRWPRVSGSPVVCLAQQLGYGARVPDGTDRDGAYRDVGRGQALRDALKLTDKRTAAGQDVVAGRPDPLQRCEHPVEQGDHDRKDHEQQNRVAYPPQDHGLFSSARGL